MARRAHQPDSSSGTRQLHVVGNVDSTVSSVEILISHPRKGSLQEPIPPPARERTTARQNVSNQQILSPGSQDNYPYNQQSHTSASRSVHGGMTATLPSYVSKTEPPIVSTRSNLTPSVHHQHKTIDTPQWFDLQYHDYGKRKIKKPDELANQMREPPKPIENRFPDRIAGSIVGMAIGDALGAHVEFRPREYLLANPVSDFGEGGTWGLTKGQFTDDTSMALCLANSLIACQGLNLYDQLVRYKWWYRHGYMSSTGACFDIGNATRDSIEEFERRQSKFAREKRIPVDQIDDKLDPELLKSFNVKCSSDGVAGNGALMRLAPVPLFFFRDPPTAVEYSGRSGQITHGDRKVYDACRYYGALIVAALQGQDKATLLDNDFYRRNRSWFGKEELHRDIIQIARGSYKKSGGYDDGIRGGGYIVKALEAALWAFWSTDSFKEGALAAVNLGDDTDTTAAIYGQLAGAVYGLEHLPRNWLDQVYARRFLLLTSRWLVYEGEQCYFKMQQRNELLSQHTSGKTKTKYPDQDNDVTKINEMNESRTGAKAKTVEEACVVTRMASALHLRGKKKHDEGSDPSNPGSISDDILNWSPEEVCRWLEKIGVNDRKSLDTFKNHRISGRELLAWIGTDRLYEMGLSNHLNHQRILEGIADLKKHVSDHNDESTSNEDYVPLMRRLGRNQRHGNHCILEPERDDTHQRIFQKVLGWSRSINDLVHVTKIELVDDPDRFDAFMKQMNTFEKQKKQGRFRATPGYHNGDSGMNKGADRVKKLARQVNGQQSIDIVRVWYTCQKIHAEEIIKNGFSGINRLRFRNPQKGICFSSSALCALQDMERYDCLIMCYLLVPDPYPVLIDNQSRRNLDSRYCFFNNQTQPDYRQQSPSLFFGTNYRPLNTNFTVTNSTDGSYDKFVTFDPNDVIPHAIIFLSVPRQN